MINQEHSTRKSSETLSTYEALFTAEKNIAMLYIDPNGPATKEKAISLLLNTYSSYSPLTSKEAERAQNMISVTEGIIITDYNREVDKQTGYSILGAMLRRTGCTLVLEDKIPDRAQVQDAAASLQWNDLIHPHEQWHLGKSHNEEIVYLQRKVLTARHEDPFGNQHDWRQVGYAIPLLEAASNIAAHPEHE